MRPRLVLPLALFIAFATGCKGMGGLASGVGKIAAGAAKGVAHVAPAVAQGVARAAPAIAGGAAKAAPAITRGVARVGSAVARGVARSAPTLLEVGEVVAEVAAAMPDLVYEVPIEVPGPSDPCEACPIDDDCGACAGYAGYACVAAPAGALARCESSAPPDAAPAPAETEPVASDPGSTIDPEPVPTPADPVVPPLGTLPSWLVF